MFCFVGYHMLTDGINQSRNNFRIPLFCNLSNVLVWIMEDKRILSFINKNSSIIV